MTHSHAPTEHPSGGTGLRGVIRRHPLPSFFTMALGLSWIAWLPYVISQNGLGLVGFSFPHGMLGQLTGMLLGAYLGPIFSAFLVTAMVGGKPAVRHWVGRIFKWNINWKWYPALLISVPLIIILAFLPFSGGHIQAPPMQALILYLPMLVMQFVTTGLAEEPGWRDFALPYLQPKFGPLRGTLILGPIWGAWHLPLFLTEWGGPHVTLLQVGEFIVMCVFISMAMTWVFNKTGESLPAAILAHISINNYFSTLALYMFPDANPQITSHVQLLASFVVGIVLLIATRGRLGYRSAAAIPPHSGGSTPPSAAAPRRVASPAATSVTQPYTLPRPPSAGMGH